MIQDPTKCNFEGIVIIRKISFTSGSDSSIYLKITETRRLGIWYVFCLEHGVEHVDATLLGMKSHRLGPPVCGSFSRPVHRTCVIPNSDVEGPARARYVLPLPLADAFVRSGSCFFITAFIIDHIAFRRITILRAEIVVIRLVLGVGFSAHP
jgi:hypothetical protein